jgi:hypothetical protein
LDVSRRFVPAVAVDRRQSKRPVDDSQNSPASSIIVVFVVVVMAVMVAC